MKTRKGVLSLLLVLAMLTVAFAALVSVMETLKKLGYNVGCLESFFDKYSYNLPSFEAVTRSRRLVQATFPELKDEHISKFRRKVKEPEFREYSKTKVN